MFIVVLLEITALYVGTIRGTMVSDQWDATPSQIGPVTIRVRADSLVVQLVLASPDFVGLTAVCVRKGS
jgi:hypothetical protein